MVKNLCGDEGDMRGIGSIPGSRGFPGEGNGNPRQSSCLEIPWTEEPGRLQSMGLQGVGHDLETGHDLVTGHDLTTDSPLQRGENHNG